jgi:type III pantothenate kinase
MRELAEPVPTLGTDTIAAMRAGLYWGTVGAMRELITRLSADLTDQPVVYLTGGAAAHVASALKPEACHVPHLILGAIAHVS